MLKVSLFCILNMCCVIILDITSLQTSHTVHDQVYLYLQLVQNNRQKEDRLRIHKQSQN